MVCTTRDNTKNDGEHQVQGRQQAQRAAMVETLDADGASSIPFFEQQGRDEEAAQDEEPGTPTCPPLKPGTPA